MLGGIVKNDRNIELLDEFKTQGMNGNPIFLLFSLPGAQKKLRPETVAYLADFRHFSNNSDYTSERTSIET